MRCRINIDDKLLETARLLTGTKETAAIVHQALETLVRVETNNRLRAAAETTGAFLHPHADAADQAPVTACEPHGGNAESRSR